MEEHAFNLCLHCFISMISGCVPSSGTTPIMPASPWSTSCTELLIWFPGMSSLLQKFKAVPDLMSRNVLPGVIVKAAQGLHWHFVNTNRLLGTVNFPNMFDSQCSLFLTCVWIRIVTDIVCHCGHRCPPAFTANYLAGQAELISRMPFLFFNFWLKNHLCCCWPQRRSTA